MDTRVPTASQLRDSVGHLLEELIVDCGSDDMAEGGYLNILLAWTANSSPRLRSLDIVYNNSGSAQMSPDGMNGLWICSQLRILRLHNWSLPEKLDDIQHLRWLSSLEVNIMSFIP